MLPSGAVVCGPFAGADRDFHHQSVVLGSFVKRGEVYAVLVYCSSKESNGLKMYGGQIAEEDKVLSKLIGQTFYDASRICLVLERRLDVKGKISDKALTEIEGKVELARSRGVLEILKCRDN